MLSCRQIREPHSGNTRWADLLFVAVALRGQGVGWPFADARILGWFHASGRGRVRN